MFFFFSFSFSLSLCNFWFFNLTPAPRAPRSEIVIQTRFGPVQAKIHLYYYQCRITLLSFSSRSTLTWNYFSHGPICGFEHKLLKLFQFFFFPTCFLKGEDIAPKIFIRRFLLMKFFTVIFPLDLMRSMLHKNKI